MSDRTNKYHRTIRNLKHVDGEAAEFTVDVYSVINAFGVTCPATAHAIKKLLCAGLRGKGDAASDLRESIQAIRRAIDEIELDLQPEKSSGPVGSQKADRSGIEVTTTWGPSGGWGEPRKERPLAINPPTP
jgi:hypothetical protein